jgi:hypothetical protein
MKTIINPPPWWRYNEVGLWHGSYSTPERFRIEYDHQTEYFKALVWIHWTWLGRGHWLMIALPEFIK